MFVCNDMSRDLILTVPQDIRKKLTGDDMTVDVNSQFRIKPGVKNQVEVPDDVFKSLLKGNKAVQAYIDTGRIRADKKRIEAPAPINASSGDAKAPEHLKNTKDAQEKVSNSSVKHESNTVAIAEPTGDDAPEGGAK